MQRFNEDDDQNGSIFRGMDLPGPAQTPDPALPPPNVSPTLPPAPTEPPPMSLKDLVAKEDSNSKMKQYMNVLGSIGQNFADVPSSHELLYGGKGYHQDVKGQMKAATDLMDSPMDAQTKAMAYMKAKREDNAAAATDKYTAAMNDPNSKESKAIKAMATKFGVPVDDAAPGADYLRLFDPKKMNEERIKGDVERQNKLLEIEAQKSADMSRMVTGKNMDLAKEKALKDLKGTEAEAAVDKDFAKDYAAWYAGGGRAAVQKNLGQMESAIQDLKNKPDLTGGTSLSIPGMNSDLVQKKLNPDMIAARDKIRGAIQNTLKETLGAQFTENEGERIMNRAFDPQLSPKENARRAQVELEGLKGRVAAKEAAGKYYEANRTLRGFKPASTSIADDKQVVKTERNKKTGETRLTYSDGSTEIKPAMAGN